MPDRSRPSSSRSAAHEHAGSHAGPAPAPQQSSSTQGGALPLSSKRAGQPPASTGDSAISRTVCVATGVPNDSGRRGVADNSATSRTVAGVEDMAESVTSRTVDGAGVDGDADVAESATSRTDEEGVPGSLRGLGAHSDRTSASSKVMSSTASSTAESARRSGDGVAPSAGAAAAAGVVVAPPGVMPPGVIPPPGVHESEWRFGVARRDRSSSV